jgi:hypothetical protein
MSKSGFANWIMMPLEEVHNQLELDIAERRWMHHFRSTLINDPLSWYQKPVKKKREEWKPIRESQQTRIEKRKLLTSEYRNKTRIILKSDIWREWSPNTLIRYLTHLKIAKIRTSLIRKAAEIVRAHLRKHHNLQIRASYDLRLLYDPSLEKASIKRWIEKRIKAELPEHDLLSKYILNHMEIRFIAEKTIGSMLNNSRHVLNEEDRYKECRCHQHEKLPMKDGHVFLRASELPDEYKELRDILTLCKKNPVTFNNRDYLGYQLRYIQRFLEKFIPNPSWRKEDNEELIKILHRNFPPDPKSPLHLSYILKAINSMRGYCFIELDKNANTWAIVCPHLYRQISKQNFNDDVFYKKIDLPENQVKELIEKKYLRLDLHKIIKGNKRWTIPNAKLLPKNKDINRFRPLVSYYRFHSRPIGKYMSRALSVVIKALSKRWCTMELQNSKDFPTSIEKLNQNERWTSTFNETTFAKFDIKNQFTNLNKTKVLKALQFALQELSSEIGIRYFAIRRRANEKHADRLGLGRKRDYTCFSFHDLLQYAIFELSTPYFKAGKQIYYQKNGLPMGGFLSAGLAVIYSMVTEYKNRRKWRHLGYKTRWFRYRDDILLIAQKRLQPEEIETIRQLLNDIYGEGLTVELEDHSYEKINFLEFWLASATPSLITWNFNKNCDTVYKTKPKQVVRFPDIRAYYQPSIFRSICSGMITKAIRASPHSLGQLIGITQLMIELKEKEYKLRWITEAIYKTNTKQRRNLKKLTQRIWILIPDHSRTFLVSNHANSDHKEFASESNFRE